MENYLLYTPRHVGLQEGNFGAGEAPAGPVRRSLYSGSSSPTDADIQRVP